MEGVTPLQGRCFAVNDMVIHRSRNPSLIDLSIHYDPVEMTYDGFSRYALSTNEVFTVTPSKRTFKIVSLERRDYFATLRTKLGWTGQIRYGELNHPAEKRD